MAIAGTSDGIEHDHTVVVVGASGLIGRFLLPRLLSQNRSLIALSRRSFESVPGVVWQRTDLAAPDAFDTLPVLAPQATVISAGPLDLFAQRLCASAWRPARIVAFSSTSAESKRASSDPDERALAERLLCAESLLEGFAQQHGCALTLLRPTLIYGGKESALTRFVALGQRCRFVPLPRSARGLRQPVHADDLAAAAVAALSYAGVPRTFSLPGGETLDYREMLHRVLAAAAPNARLIGIPDPLWRLASTMATGAFARMGASAAALDRMVCHLVFDDAAARLHLGYRPRLFRPQAADFE